uniref:DNA polymerase n=1 Tax=Biomphalaria glabrata TaxID=6526 RepID=A0A2C9M9B8_BIOGL
MYKRGGKTGQPPAKKSKNFNDDFPSTFEDDLALMDSLEADRNDSEPMEVTGDGPEYQATSAKWARPPLPDIDSSEDKIVFQQIDLDYYVGSHVQGMPGATVGPTPIIRMYGITMEGNSVMAHIHGFAPYFYIPAQPGFHKEDCEKFLEHLNTIVRKDLRSNKEGIVQAVLAVECVERESIYGYHGNKKSLFLKITVAIPRLIAPCKRLLEQGIQIPGYSHHGFQTYESNIDFEIRFMVDANVVGCNWIELPADKYSIRDKHKAVQHTSDMVIASRCQLEVDIAWTDLISHQTEGEWSKVAPFRILSFDIECAGRKGIFPEPNKDPVIQIANMVVLQGESEPFIRNVFTLKSCAPVVGSQVLSYETETELLQKWASFFREVDPDIVTGYNIQNFDFPYLINRANHLKVKDFSFLGRIKNILSVIKDLSIQSKQRRILIQMQKLITAWMFCLSVTAFGRTMIEKTKKHVEETYTRANGYEHDAKVIYGDTDSVMCKFGVTTVEAAMKLGKEAAEFISTKFVSPIKLEFEKILLRDYKLRSYTLNAVSFHFLQEQKEDVQHSIITDLQHCFLFHFRAKNDLKNETDPFKKKVLDGRQLALKISANSVYGFTGAQVGKLPCLEISSSVTAFGRTMIEKTKKHVEETYTRANGYEHDAKVIYGDTDSVMCKFGVTTVEAAMKLGKEAAEFISTKFVSPIKLEFEKVYFPYLLINKKRYAGLFWTNPKKHDKMDCKGIETVRRDNAPIVAHLINTCLKLLLIESTT